MKKLWVIVLLSSIIILTIGCSKNFNTKQNNEITMLKQEDALKIASEASSKFHTITVLGYGIPDCTFEEKELVEINGDYYNNLCSTINTVEKLNAYLADVFTDKSIGSIIDNYFFVIENGKILKLNVDVSGGIEWYNAEIISLKQNGELAEVEFKVPLVIGEGGLYDNIKVTYKYIQNQGWRIDTSPYHLY